MHLTILTPSNGVCIFAVNNNFIFMFVNKLEYKMNLFLEKWGVQITQPKMF